LAILIQWVTTFFAGFAIAFSQEWRLTLLLVAVTPFLAVSGAILASVTAAFANKEQKQYASAGGVAEEVLSSIRTVFAFGGELKEAAK
jgi:ATP-binding cassette subfamily B (MDR/TAP) protein 1